MLKRFLALFLFGALLTASAAACGGGGAMSLEDYFKELDTIFGDMDAGSDDLNEQYPESFSDPDETRDYLDGSIPLVEGAVGDVSDLDPPAEAEDAHNEFLDAADEALEALDTVREGVADAETPGDIDAVVNETDPVVSRAAQRFEDACLELQGVADANNIDVDLCEE